MQDAVKYLNIRAAAAAGCHFSAGRPSFVCDGVTCGCPKGCPSTYLKTFQDVSGAVTLTCDATGQDCSIVVSQHSCGFSTAFFVDVAVLRQGCQQQQAAASW
jgi:hypothetical protein